MGLLWFDFITVLSCKMCQMNLTLKGGLLRLPRTNKQHGFEISQCDVLFHYTIGSNCNGCKHNQTKINYIDGIWINF